MSNLPPSPDNPEYQVPDPLAQQPQQPQQPAAQPPFQPPFQQGAYPPNQYPVSNDPLERMIPYKNPPALIAYYLGVFSIVVPFMGIASIVLGVIGISKHKRNPLVRGMGHAITGIVLGLLSVVGWSALFIAIRNAS